MGAWLKERASQEMEARLVAQVERTRVKAFNVVTKVEGGDHTLPPSGYDSAQWLVELRR